jgi:hypothetical protein
MSHISGLEIPGLVIPDAISPEAAPIVADICDRFAADRRFSLTRADCKEVGGWKQSTQILKEKSGVLSSILDGAIRRITTRSLYQHLVDLAVASYPVGGPPARARSRQSKTRFRAKPFVPSGAQLEGLRRGNAQRAAEAKARREAMPGERPLPRQRGMRREVTGQV